MCDTLGRVDLPVPLFAKNSDRSPNEPQVIEYHPACAHTEKELAATYIKIEQVKNTHAMILSRPAWMWGAEMGVNDCGVCIGNEAVFTKGGYAKFGLTGMDLLRLGLERGDSALSAVLVIIEQLERYGQGGNCGYDHKFYYDNSFLVMDRSELYVLETCGKKWVYKKTEAANISNRLGIEKDGTAYSDNHRVNFAWRHIGPLFTRFSGSWERRRFVAEQMKTLYSPGNAMAVLRTHAPERTDPLCC
ncbi:MAG: hypothetical protein PHO41_01240, partial [Eubacteriales bacterium]|nr:hypothetical protein [Eubacteriales bacterium]